MSLQESSYLRYLVVMALGDRTPLRWVAEASNPYVCIHLPSKISFANFFSSLDATAALKVPHGRPREDVTIHSSDTHLHGCA